MWWIVVSLLVLGIILMLVEMMLIPGVGVAGFLSLGSLVAACWYAFAEISTAAGWWTLLAAVLLLAVLLFFALRAKTWKRFELQEVIAEPAATGLAFVPGDHGVTVTRLAPMGMARINSRSVEVTSEEGMLDPGIEIEVTRVEGNKIFVKHI